MDKQPNNPLHGIKLADIVSELETHFGWQELGKIIDIRCFNHEPSVKSSLKFLRKTPWAREKVEQLYVTTFCETQASSESQSSFVWPNINKK